MDIDIGFSEIATLIAESTTAYLVKISPLILLVAGILLAFGIIYTLATAFLPKKSDNDNV